MKFMFSKSMQMKHTAFLFRDVKLKIVSQRMSSRDHEQLFVVYLKDRTLVIT